MNTNTVTIRQYQSPEEAPTYRLPEHKGVNIEYVNIVRNGTVEGNSTVDIIFVDEDGQKYMTMITGRIFDSIARAIGERQ